MSRSVGIYEPFVDAVALEGQQAEIAKNISASSFPAQLIAECFHIDPSRLSGERVIDTASGASDFVWWLNENGVSAYGVDIGYDDVGSFLERVGLFHDGHILTAPDEFKGVPKSRFTEDFDANPSRYVAGSIVELPEDDGSIDRVTNHSCLTAVNGPMPDFTIASVFEALRVLNRGGIFNIGPLLLDRRKFPSETVVECFEREEAIYSAIDLSHEVGIKTKVAKTNFCGLWNLTVTRTK